MIQHWLSLQAMSWERSNRQLRRQTAKDNREVLRNLTETTLLAEDEAREEWKALAKETRVRHKALEEERRARAEAYAKDVEMAKEENLSALRAREENSAALRDEKKEKEGMMEPAEEDTSFE